MADYTHTIQLQLTTNSGTLSGTHSVSADGQTSRQISLTALQANKEYDIDLVSSRIKSWFIKLTGACTVKTNSTSAPDTTLTVNSDGLLGWNSAMMFTNPLIAADITKLYFTDVSNAVNTGELVVLYDSTP